MWYGYKGNKNLWHKNFKQDRINFTITCSLEELKLIIVRRELIKHRSVRDKGIEWKIGEKKFHATRYIFAWMIVVTWSLLVVHGYILSHRRRDILCTFPFEKSTLWKKQNQFTYGLRCSSVSRNHAILDSHSRNGVMQCCHASCATDERGPFTLRRSVTDSLKSLSRTRIVSQMKK